MGRLHLCSFFHSSCVPQREPISTCCAQYAWIGSGFRSAPQFLKTPRWTSTYTLEADKFCYWIDGETIPSHKPISLIYCRTGLIWGSFVWISYVVNPEYQVAKNCILTDILTSIPLLPRSQDLMLASSIETTFSASLASQRTLQSEILQWYVHPKAAELDWLGWHPARQASRICSLGFRPACRSVRLAEHICSIGIWWLPRQPASPLNLVLFFRRRGLYLRTRASKPFSSPILVSSLDPLFDCHKFTPQIPSAPNQIQQRGSWASRWSKCTVKPLLRTVMNWSTLMGFAARSQTSGGWTKVSTVWMDSEPSSYSTRRT